MHPNIIIIISRSHWRCVTCKIYNKHLVSIDEHLKTGHPELGLMTPQRKLNYDGCSYSDGELETKLHYKFIASKSKASDTGKEITCSEFVPQNVLVSSKILQEDAYADNVANGLKAIRRKTSRKQPKKAIKRQRLEVTKNSSSFDLSLGNPSYLSDNEGFLDKKTEDKDKATQRQKMHMLKIHLKKQPPPLPHLSVLLREKRTKYAESVNEGFAIKTVLTNLDTGKRTRKNIQAKKQIKTISLEACMHKSIVNSNKRHASNEIEEQSKIEEQLLPKYLKETCLDGEKECPQMLYKEQEKKRKTRKMVDKSQIATCCAPWLFDSRRKAGDKVNKKPRRKLLPEEKDAVRDLYGIPPAAKPTPSDVSLERHSIKLESRHVEDNKNLSHVPLEVLSIVEHSVRQEESLASQRFMLMNMFSPSSHGFFMDNIRAQESLFSDVNMFQHQDQVNQQHAVQGAEVCPANTSSTTPHCGTPVTLTVSSHSAPSLGVCGTAASALGNCTDSSFPVTAETNLQQSQVLSDHLTLGNQNVTQNPLVTASTCFDDSHHQLTGLLAPSIFQQDNAGNKDGSLKEINQCQEDDALKGKNLYNEDDALKGNNQCTEAESAKGNIQCTICQEVFTSPNKINKHKKDVVDFITVICKRCKRKFHGMHELNMHIFSEHEVEKQGFCFICNEETSGLETLEKHVFRHIQNSDRMLSDMRFHDCRICGEELHSSYPIIRTHYYRHHIAHVCAVCFQNFNNILAYEEHCSTCSHSGTEVFCSICGGRFESVSKLKVHFPCPEDVWGEDGKGAQCSKCGLWCPNRAVVQAHRRQHRSQEDVEAYRKGAQQGFPCMSCEKIFKNKHACRRHLKMVHEGVQCYKHYCEYCGKGFLTKGHMRDHIALHHLGIKRYQCDYCNQQFVCAPTLRRHVRKEHTKHKPYKCEHCGECFFEKTPLQRHLTVHTGLAPFMCEHCGKGFYTKHSFTNHGTTHSTSRDFVCSGCHKEFTRKYNLQAHIKICKQL